MEDSITIKIRNYSELTAYLSGFEAVVFSIWVALLMNYFDVVSLIVLLVLVALAVTHMVLLQCVPTVVTADNEMLMYKHVFGCKKIYLSEISKVSYERFDIPGRYSSYPHIRLTVSTFSGNDFELNDEININKLVDNAVESQKSELPIMQLYAFLHSRIDSENKPSE